MTSRATTTMTSDNQPIYPYDAGDDFDAEDYGNDDLDKEPGNDEGIG